MPNCLKKAIQSDFVWGFNINGLEEVKALVYSVNKYNKIAIMLVSPNTIKHIGIEYIASIAGSAKKLSRNRLFIQLDHATDESLIIECINSGFDSVMIDNSGMSMHDYVLYVNKISNIAKSLNKNIIIEAEIGQLAHHSTETTFNIKTLPENIKFFQENSYADILAVSVGNSHGLLNPKPPLDRELIKLLHEVSNIPLVLHGGDWLSTEEIEFVITHGFRKINIGPELRLLAGLTINNLVLTNQHDPTDYRKLMNMIKESIIISINTKFLITYDYFS